MLADTLGSVSDGVATGLKRLDKMDPAMQKSHCPLVSKQVLYFEAGALPGDRSSLCPYGNCENNGSRHKSIMVAAGQRITL